MPDDVAQIFNLPYRRIGFCGRFACAARSGASEAQPIANRRYGRLKICATPHQFTTFCGLPARKARTFSAAMRMSRARAARVAQALCGVMMQFIARSNGLLAGGGSTE